MRLWPLLLTLCLGACANTTFHEAYQRAVAPLSFINDDRPTAGEVYLRNEDEVFRPMQDLNLAEQSDERMAAKEGYAPEPTLPANCSFSDRFDRDGALAYNFDGGQKRIALHLEMGDVGFGGVEVDKVMVHFRYKFQQPTHSRKDACRYPSEFQGLIGSGYNEFVRRRHDTVWDELHDKNPLGIFD